MAVTVRGVPEGVQPPVVTALSPSSLHVSWSEPTRPNGLIQRYRLNQTGVGTIFTHNDGPRNYTVTGKIFRFSEMSHFSFTLPPFLNSLSLSHFTSSPSLLSPVPVLSSPPSITLPSLSLISPSVLFLFSLSSSCSCTSHFFPHLLTPSPHIPDILLSFVISESSPFSSSPNLLSYPSLLLLFLSAYLSTPLLSSPSSFSFPFVMHLFMYAGSWKPSNDWIYTWFPPHSLWPSPLHRHKHTHMNTHRRNKNTTRTEAHSNIIDRCTYLETHEENTNISTQTAQQKQCETQCSYKTLKKYSEYTHRQTEVSACLNIVDLHRNTVVSGLGDLWVLFYLPWGGAVLLALCHQSQHTHTHTHTHLHMQTQTPAWSIVKQTFVVCIKMEHFRDILLKYQ